jgi:hypothetical protein
MSYSILVLPSSGTRSDYDRGYLRRVGCLKDRKFLFRNVLLRYMYVLYMYYDRWWSDTPEIFERRRHVGVIALPRAK